MREAEFDGSAVPLGATVFNRADQREIERRLRAVDREARYQRERIVDRQLRQAAEERLPLSRVEIGSWMEPRATLVFWGETEWELTMMSPESLSRFVLHCRRRGAYLASVLRLPFSRSYRLRFKDSQGQRFGITAVVDPKRRAQR